MYRYKTKAKVPMNNEQTDTQTTNDKNEKQAM
jgi:hypothetical protein